MWKMLSVATAALLVITACSDQKSSLPQQQAKLCETVTRYRELYATEKQKEFYIDKDETLTRIFSERTSELRKVLGEGQVDGWHGTIKKILVSQGKGAFLEVTLPCKVLLKPQDSLIIKIDTPLYETLRQFHENSEIIFSGNFLVSPSNAAAEYPYKTYYGETSFTESGSMDEPEFLFMFREIR